MRAGLIVFGLILPWAAQAHDFGCDGNRVPPEVKMSCCGKGDAHLVGPGTNYPLTQIQDGWQLEVNGQAQGFKDEEIIPSNDGCYWAWWSEGSKTSGCAPEGGDCKALDRAPIYFYCLMIPYPV